MEDYTHLSDEQLQSLAASGDSAAEELLADRFSSLAQLIAQSYHIAGADSDDLAQEGRVGLISAIRGYKDSLGVPFHSYAEICIRRRIFSAIRSAARWKHTPLNNGVSLEETLTAPKRDTNARILSEQRRTPEEQVLARESAEEFSDSFSRLLSPFEQSVIRLYLDGYSYRAMACRLDRDEKSIDNAVQRIRRKLARIYSSGDFSES
ncbi:MAG: sigma-70 family RNA polymerase sigma factor [Oscillospiraceae bacterium]|nr:sigma-70 family RNA polymerase sigma factor [Oscillospiraceae bacterium]